MNHSIDEKVNFIIVAFKYCRSELKRSCRDFNQLLIDDFFVTFIQTSSIISDLESQISQHRQTIQDMEMNHKRQLLVHNSYCLFTGLN